MGEHGADDLAAGYRVDDLEVHPAACEIVRDGRTVRVEPQVMALLQLLSTRPGAVFTRAEIEAQVWPGLVVGYDSLTKCVAKLRDALGDTQKPPRLIQTIPKRGYRLVARVSLGAEPPVALPPEPAPRRLRAGVAALLVIAVAVAGTLWATLRQVPADAGAPPVVMVLPFTDGNRDPQQSYFARGLTDDLITDLSGYDGIDVVNSRVAFQYRDADIDPEQLAATLGVRYIVEGHIHRTAQQLRINVSLIDTQHRTNLWAARYNRPLDALFDIQDDLRTSVVAALSSQLGRVAERGVRRRDTSNYAAYDHFLRGQNSLIQRASASDNRQARREFEDAIAIDPDFSRAYAALAMANTDAYRHDWSNDPALTGRVALQQARHALELSPGSPHASLAMGYAQFFVAGNHQAAIDMAERTLALDKKNADANLLLAAVYVHSGRYGKAEAYVESSMRLNANPPSIYFAISALTALLRGDTPQALQDYRQSLLVNPDRLLGKIYIAITLVRLNRIEDARWYADEILAASPGFDAGGWADKQPFKDRRINIGLRDDLRRAGLK